MWSTIKSHGKDARSARTLDVRADDADARDCIYAPSLAQLPIELDNRRWVPKLLDQGSEGACVGFALAAVINLSLKAAVARTPSVRRKAETVSAQMLYEMGRRYDEWKGEAYVGTSLRGAMKAWHKHGVASEGVWPNDPTKLELTDKRAEDAQKRPLGAYFRIVDSNPVHLQAAVLEGDSVLASVWVHSGWNNDVLVKKGPRRLARIPFRDGRRGLHAVALVGYTPDGLIVQNSWGTRWGSGGFALLGYDDWFANRQDAWVARPGPQTRDSKGKARVFLDAFAGEKEEAGRVETAAQGLDIEPAALPFFINTGDRGALSSGGRLTTRPEDLPDMARRVLGATPVKGTRHVMLYAHGGLNSETAGVESANRIWAMCKNEKRNLTAYFFVWQSGIEDSILGWLRSQDDAAGPGPAGLAIADLWEKIKSGAGKVIRDVQKQLGRALRTKVKLVLWDEMKGRAEGSSKHKGGAQLFAAALFAEMLKDTRAETFTLHLVGHSAGSIYLAQLYRNFLKANLNQTKKVKLGSIQFMAPAITVAATRQLLLNGTSLPVPAKSFRTFMLRSKDEERDNILIYPSSLLTYVADCLEGPQRVPVLGIRRDFDHAQASLGAPVGLTASVSEHHGDFDEKEHEIEGVVNDIASGKFE